MYSIFRPLDPTEPLPRELILDTVRRRRLELRDLDMRGAFFLPMLLIAFVGLASLRMPALLAFGLSALAVTGFHFAVASVRRLTTLHS
jgi:hypothetical protein